MFVEVMNVGFFGPPRSRRVSVASSGAAKWRRVPDLSDNTDATAALLQRTRRIAMVGASDKEGRPSSNVFAFLIRRGYDVLPVNPTADAVHGVPTVPDLAAAARHWPEGIDLVDVFRRPDAVEPVVDEAIAVGARAIWFQLGVINEAAIAKALEAGLEVVVDRCPAIEIPRLGL